LPESAGSDEHLFNNLREIAAFMPHLVVVDAISACRRMGSGKAAFDYCMRLVNDCKKQGITSILTNQTEASNLGDDLSGLGFASLVDTVIQLSFEAKGDELTRSFIVLKSRGSSHSFRYHDFSITDRGIVLVPRA
jgi:circadian clock protein KaiC